jgi:hypothetical protein
MRGMGRLSNQKHEQHEQKQRGIHGTTAQHNAVS